MARPTAKRSSVVRLWMSPRLVYSDTSGNRRCEYVGYKLKGYKCDDNVKQLCVCSPGLSELFDFDSAIICLCTSRNQPRHKQAYRCIAELGASGGCWLEVFDHPDIVSDEEEYDYDEGVILKVEFEIGELLAEIYGLHEFYLWMELPA